MRLLAILSLLATLAAAGGGVCIDPNGGGASVDEGFGIDPWGGCAASNVDRGPGMDPNG